MALSMGLGGPWDRTATLETKLLQQLWAMREVVLYKILLDLQKA